MSTGWTFEQVGDQFDIPRLLAMYKYWKSFPPIHVMLSSYFGISKKTEQVANVNPENPGLLEAIQAFQNGG
jgi:hypothetical protein